MEITVRAGDTLWGLATRYLGSAFRWPEIFAINHRVIREAQIARGADASRRFCGPDWIFVGTVLRLPAR